MRLLLICHILHHNYLNNQNTQDKDNIKVNILNKHIMGEGKSSPIYVFKIIT
jgi:hypothetical protein